MSKEEAIQAMKEGKKVTHRFFSSDEWMTIENGFLLFRRWRTYLFGRFFLIFAVIVFGMMDMNCIPPS